jgi:hypothetical protein
LSPAPALANGPFFIVGAPRSGTTLLQYMLRSHPRLSVPTGESHFFIPLYQGAATFGDLGRVENVRAVLAAMHAQSADFLETDLHGVRFDMDRLAGELRAEGRRTMRDLVAGLFEKNAAGEGKARWGDKTPYYGMHIPKLLEWFPDAQFIHLVRDGRDVALSLFARRHDFGVYNTYYAGKYWQQFVEATHEHGAKLDPAQYLEIRYEDLVAEPRAASQRICAFLGEEFSEAVVDFKPAGQAGKTPLLQKPVQADNAGKWRRALAPRQIRYFEAAAGTTLERFGYPLATSVAPLPKPLRAIFWTHNRAVRRVRRWLAPLVQASAKNVQAQPRGH